MSGKNKPDISKPPVPARPKNLVILNSKHLPKPPETFLSENVTNFIKVLNLDVKDEDTGPEKKSRARKFEGSDGEEDPIGYLEPLSMQSLSVADVSAKMNTHAQISRLNSEDNSKFGDLFRKVINRSNSYSSGRYSQSVLNPYLILVCYCCLLKPALVATKALPNRSEFGPANWQTVCLTEFKFVLGKFCYEKECDMWANGYFYLKMAKSVVANLARRLSYEITDLGFYFKRRLRQTLQCNAEFDKSYRAVFLEASELEETKSVGHSQWQRPLPSLPLPPVETKALVATMPWFKNVDRRGGEEILRNGINGYFLVRPSSNADTYLTLTLWYGKRAYNIPIRRRKDGKFALGTPKTHEQCFDSVEYLVKNYQSEKLVLYSNGVQTGKTLLTSYPP